MPVDILFLLLGLVLLIAGGDLLVRGAVRIAERLRLSPMLIGLTVVGMGTSTPELAASLQASLAGSPGIALGNIVGSNIANTLLILGVAALIAPIAVNARTLWRDGGLGILAALALLAAGATVGLSRGAASGFWPSWSGTSTTPIGRSAWARLTAPPTIARWPWRRSTRPWFRTIGQRVGCRSHFCSLPSVWP
ncbi:sodium:calcium antiporter [Brevundimonas denitrificans]|uniref:sodium:calcium antiporter n=1 Tax=Brevundimonas denitrificans TaxID=1443434 RepID=UPI00223B811B|nr:hypothetical protein [Brevundimonas denitrificans]